VLYNNAGISPADDASILETEPGAWQRVQDVNTKSVYLCCKYGIPYLLERGGGSVINVASFVALTGAATSQISYTASKGAVLSLSRELGSSSRGRASASTLFVRGGRATAPPGGSSAMIPPHTSGVASTCRWAGSPSRVRS
jgi:NAD(P)-dependent dehydrogenase (short-subunit alcohol dehydrogenase family)